MLSRGYPWRTLARRFSAPTVQYHVRSALGPGAGEPLHHRLRPLFCGLVAARCPQRLEDGVFPVCSTSSVPVTPVPAFTKSKTPPDSTGTLLYGIYLARGPMPPALATVLRAWTSSLLCLVGREREREVKLARTWKSAGE